jgi:purine-binding chemotaxis protein CheW
MARKNRQSTKVDEFQAIGFRVGTEEYGLALDDVQEIITTPHITRVPKAPPHIKGVINLHGNVIPVFDLARRFEIGETDFSESSRVVVVEYNGEAIGLAAEGVSNVTKLARNSVRPPPPLVSGIAAEYLNGVAKLPNRFLIFLNLPRVLSNDAVVKQ